MTGRTILDYDYAKLVADKVNNSTATLVAAAFKKALDRKLAGEDSDTIEQPGENATDSQRFEFFFHELFDIGPDSRPLDNALIREKIVEARDFLRQDAENCRKSRKYGDLVDMKLEDAQAYEDMLTLFDKGDFDGVRRRYWNQDTAARDYLFIGNDTIANRKVWHRLNEWLNVGRG